MQVSLVNSCPAVAGSSTVPGRLLNRPLGPARSCSATGATLQPQPGQVTLKGGLPSLRGQGRGSSGKGGGWRAARVPVSSSRGVTRRGAGSAWALGAGPCLWWLKGGQGHGEHLQPGPRSRGHLKPRGWGRERKWNPRGQGGRWASAHVHTHSHVFCAGPAPADREPRQAFWNLLGIFCSEGKSWTLFPLSCPGPAHEATLRHHAGHSLVRRWPQAAACRHRGPW